MLVGHVADVVTFYKAMDLFVFPFHREGFPNAPMETACMGLPVIATAVVGCIDAVVNGETGTLVPPHDSGALAEAIRKYLADPALRQRRRHLFYQYIKNQTEFWIDRRSKPLKFSNV